MAPLLLFLALLLRALARGATGYGHAVTLALILQGQPLWAIAAALVQCPWGNRRGTALTGIGVSLTLLAGQFLPVEFVLGLGALLALLAAPSGGGPAAMVRHVCASALSWPMAWGTPGMEGICALAVAVLQTPLQELGPEPRPPAPPSERLLAELREARASERRLQEQLELKSAERILLEETSLCWEERSSREETAATLVDCARRCLGADTALLFVRESQRWRLLAGPAGEPPACLDLAWQTGKPQWNEGSGMPGDVAHAALPLAGVGALYLGRRQGEFTPEHWRLVSLLVGQARALLAAPPDPEGPACLREALAGLRETTELATSLREAARALVPCDECAVTQDGQVLSATSSPASVPARPAQAGRIDEAPFPWPSVRSLLLIPLPGARLLLCASRAPQAYQADQLSLLEMLAWPLELHDLRQQAEYGQRAASACRELKTGLDSVGTALETLPRLQGMPNFASTLEQTRKANQEATRVVEELLASD